MTNKMNTIKTSIIIALALVTSVAVKAQDVKLIPNELTFVNYFYAGKDYKFREYTECDPFPVDTLLDISITTEAYYSSLKESQISYIVVDTANHYKKDSILILPVGKNFIELKDEKNIEGNYNSLYFYEGEIPFLNSYLISWSGYEDYSLFLIDKTTGEHNKIGFAHYPFISPNKKYVVCIYENYFFTRAEMQVFKIVEGNIEFLYLFHFVNWLPTAEGTSLVWIDDNSFVIKVIHPSFQKKPDIQNEKGEYIKIEILK